MLIRIFKRNAPLIPALILVIGLLLWGDGFFFTHELESPIQDAGPLFRLIEGFLLAYPLASRILAFLLLLLQVFYLNNIVHTISLLGKPSWLPGFIYLLMMSSHPEFLQFHPVLLANLFLMMALSRTLVSFSEVEPMVEVFNVGFLIAVAGLFYYPALVFAVWLILSMTVFFLVSIRGLSAGLMVLLCPFFFLFSFYYLSDQFEVRFALMAEQFDFLMILEHSFTLYSALLVLFLAFLSLFSFLKVSIANVHDKPIRIRKRFRVLWYLFLVALLSFLFVKENFELHLAIVMIPLCVVSALFLMEMKKKRLAELILYGFLILIIAGKVLFRS